MLRSAGILFLLLAVLAPLRASRYAFIVGQNRGGETVDDLRYAEKDARRFADLLREYAGVDKVNLRLLLRPDSASLSKSFIDFSDGISAGPNPEHALLFFFYSGHADGEGLLLDSTHMAFKELHRMVAGVAVGIRLVILDACQSGAIMAFKGGKRVEPFYMQHQRNIQGEIWIASSSADERAQESATLKSSLFSFHLFNGLRGSADISNDNKVTVGEAYQYAYRKTLETSMLTSGIVQHPLYRFNITGQGDVVVTDLSERRGGILIDGSCSGSFLIMSRDYTTVFADFHKGTGEKKFIALPTGDFTIINARGGNDIGLFRFSLSGKKTQNCGNGQFEVSLGTRARMKGPKKHDGASSDMRSLEYGDHQKEFAVNGGIGVTVFEVPDESRRSMGLSMGLGAGYRFREHWLLMLSFLGTPGKFMLFSELGVERRFPHGFGYSFVGGGIAAGWNYYRERNSTPQFGPGVYFTGGVVLKVTDALSIGVAVPFRYIDMVRGGGLSTGIALRLEWLRDSAGQHKRNNR